MIKRILMICGIIFLFSHQLMAQTVTGKVADNTTGEVLPGVNIVVKGTTIGTSTFADGSFELNVPSLSDTLSFSFIGYETLDIPIDGRTTINVELDSQAISGEELVVVGYGTMSRKEVTGSVSTVRAEDFSEGPVNNPIGLIQGQVPGLDIRTSGGNPNSGYQIRLRGLNSLSGGKSPLIVVDGGVWTNSLEAIDPNSIASIDVLKDGSAAAIYGTRATNGVILITTKTPQVGSINFEFNSSLSTEVSSDVDRYLSPNEYRDVVKEYYPNREEGLISGNNTNWVDQVSRNAFNQEYRLTASGGSENISVRASLFYKDDQGLIQKTGAKTLTPSLFISQKGLDGNLQIDYRLRYSIINREQANLGVIGQALRRNPTEPVFDPEDTENNGYYTVVGSSGYLNPVAMLNEMVNPKEDKYFTGSMSASYNLTNSLGLSLDGSYNTFQTYSGFYQTRNYPEVGTDGNAIISAEDRYDVSFEPGFEFITDIGEHGLQALGGFSYFRNEYKNLQANNYNFDVDNFSFHNIGAGSAIDDGLATMGSAKTTNKLISYYGRTMYNYSQKYLASASVRYEGSTRFGANNKWGLFPAVSVGWRIVEEDFANDIEWLSNLKLRAGYGVTGNQSIPNYQSLSLIQVSSRQGYYNGRWLNTYQPASNPNPDLKWEKKGEFNVGMDFGLFSNRISGSVEYYQRNISDLLWWYDVPVPPNVFNQIYANVGDMENKGIEFSIQWETMRNDNFSWTNNLNYDRNRNKMISLSDPSRGYELEELRVNPAAGTWTQLLQEGKPVGNFVAPVYEGIDENGDAIYKDVNGDGEVNIDSPEDREVVGNEYPKFSVGWNSKFQYKNLFASFFFRGVYGHSLLNYERIFFENWQPLLGGRNILRSTLDNPEYTGLRRYDSRFVEDASYIKLDNLTIGYNLRFAGSSLLRVSLTGQNLFTITDYSGYSPEQNLSGFNTNVGQSGAGNMNYYPYTRTFSLNLNYKF